jgi:NADH-quinone oxidoreductase subunit G
MPKITINEQEIDAKDGQTVIQTAIEHGIDVPHYCYHPDLPIDGNCRMCLVEVEKMPKLTPSCTTVCSEGMKVTTDNERVKMAVRGVLEFLLINHPVDCPVCDQAGECRLQDYYMVYGLHTSEIPMDMKVHKRKVVDLGEMVVLDQERCILCSRCIRFFDHVTGTGEMQFFGRGDHTVIGTIDDRPLENPYSGNVVFVRSGRSLRVISGSNAASGFYTVRTPCAEAVQPVAISELIIVMEQFSARCRVAISM